MWIFSKALLLTYLFPHHRSSPSPSSFDLISDWGTIQRAESSLCATSFFSPLRQSGNNIDAAENKREKKKWNTGLLLKVLHDKTKPEKIKLLFNPLSFPSPPSSLSDLHLCFFPAASHFLLRFSCDQRRNTNQCFNQPKSKEDMKGGRRHKTLRSIQWGRKQMEKIHVNDKMAVWPTVNINEFQWTDRLSSITWHSDPRLPHPPLSCSYLSWPRWGDRESLTCLRISSQAVIWSPSLSFSFKIQCPSLERTTRAQEATFSFHPSLLWRSPFSLNIFYGFIV